MENAKNLIREYVLAGFSKIHIDTSMPLNGDFENEIFDDSLIAIEHLYFVKLQKKHI